MRLEDFAEHHGVLVDTPRAGDFYIAAGRAARPLQQVGVVTQVQLSIPIPGLPGAMCHTARGVCGASPAEGRPYLGIVQATRYLTTARGDRFIRWADLDWRHILTDRVAA